MRNISILFLVMFALTACKKEQKQEPAQVQAQASVQNPVTPPPPSIEELAVRSIANKEDWTKDLGVYIDDVMACVKDTPGQAKYVFRADAFENPPVALVLLKTEADLVYACSFNENDPKPYFKKVSLVPPKNTPRFYPGNLPKADSCLENTRILDKSGNTAGWLAKIIC